MNADIIIHVESLTKKFGDFVAVDNISFDVRKGEIFGFLGANGAGKTTAIRMLSGLLQPSGGKASVMGYDVYTQSEKIKAGIGYMSQRFSLYDDLTVIENMKFYGGIYGLSKNDLNHKIQEVIGILKIDEFKNQLVKSLPLGWKQKLAFSISILHNPALVFLDEPTGGVDPVTRREFWELIMNSAHQGTTIFVTTHYMDEAEYCNTVSIMVDGRIDAMNTPQELKKQFNSQDIHSIFVNLARQSTRKEFE
ncbi:MAG: ABC transporter ATP-binding protein [Saprospiraceae bacterium]|nr:ABC transporter ATP-binding protein [Saprospiraceae bacterium]